jgi:hypothetical protein
MKKETNVIDNLNLRRLADPVLRGKRSVRKPDHPLPGECQRQLDFFFK